MRVRSHIRAAVAALIIAADLLTPAIALAQEDHSHGEGSLFWPCGVFMASMVTAALFFGGYLLQTRSGGGSTMGISALFDLPWTLFNTTPKQTTPAAAESPGKGLATKEEYHEEPPEQQSPEEASTPKRDTPVTPEEARKAPKHVETRYNPVTKRIEIRQGDVWVQAGLKGGYYGKGGGPGHDPFSDAPPVADARIGDVTLHKREDFYSAKTRTGDSAAETTLTHDAKSGTTQLKRKDFSLTNRNQEWTVFDKIRGDKIGVRFDGSTDDFTLWRNKFLLNRTGDTWRAGNTPKKGTDWAAVYDAPKDTYGLTVGKRGIGREGNQYVADWGNAAAGVETHFGRYSFGHKTGGGKVYHEYTLGRDGQTGFERTQPVKLFGKKAELKAGFENYLKQVGGAERMTRQRSIGVNTGKFKLEFIHQDGHTGGKLITGGFTKRF